MFDRFDIAEAWYLFLSTYHKGMHSEYYQRLSRMQEWFKPRPNLKYETLSDNSKCIYRDLVVEEGTDASTLPIVDEMFGQWFKMRAGMEQVYIRVKHFEDAVEALIEWCDHPKRVGIFEGVTVDDIIEAAKDLSQGAPDAAAEHVKACIDAGNWEDPRTAEARQWAEDNLYMVGHTTLEHWNYAEDGEPGLPSTEWGGHEVGDPCIIDILNERAEEEEDDEL